MKLKLHQFLSRAGAAPKKDDIYDMIEAGRVSVGGKTITAASYMFDPKRKVVTLDGSIVRMNKYRYFLANKPAGVSCQKGESPNIYEWFKKNAHLNSDTANSLFAVGRLDKETEGLIILTNDGQLANKLLQPVEEIEKEYEAELKGRISKDSLERLRRGVLINLAGGRYRTAPAKVELIHEGEARSEIRVTITEGKKRQVRLMCKAVGHPVIFLKRVRIGRLELGGMSGECFLEIDPARLAIL